MKVQLAGIVEESVTDGPGIRTTLFFQGCAHHCKGCHNPQTWDFQGGYSTEVDALLAGLLDSPLIKGFTFTGGDPFYQPQAAVQIARQVKARGKDVWTYTGFTWEELLAEADPARMELLKCSDVLVDGPFLQAQADATLPFSGSANQRMILVADSLSNGGVQLLVLP